MDRETRAVVLLKKLHAADPERRRRFAEEARLAAGVVHPNVVRVLYVGDDSLVAEWVEGADLGIVIDEVGPLPPVIAALVAREAAQGLAAVHAAGVLHRDISAANVLLGLDGTVKITDFGLSSLAAEDEGEVRGTLGTLAPDVVRGDPPSERSDLFSLGAVLTHALTGRAPFAGGSPSDTLDAVLHSDPAAALDADPRVPAVLAAIAGALLAKDPAERPASAADAADRLTSALAALGAPDASDIAAFLDDPAAYRPPPVPAAASSPPAVPTPARRSWPLVAGGLGLAAALVGLVLASVRPSDPPPRPAFEPPATQPVDVVARTPVDSVDPETEEPTETHGPLPPPPESGPPELDEAREPAVPPLTRGPLPPVDSPPPSRPAPTDEPPRAVVQTGTLTVAAEPWARVRVGGRDLGETPIAAVTLPAGEHVLTLSNPEFPVHTVRIRIEAGEQTETVVSLWELVARITVEVSPWARVSVDGEAWDVVPPQSRPLVLAPGEHVLSFEHSTLGTREVRLRVAAGERRTVRVRMGEG